MNEYNKQIGYLSVLNKNNPYIDDITFDKQSNQAARNQQAHYLFLRFASMTNIFNNFDLNSRVLLNLRSELLASPSKYGINYANFAKAYLNIINIINDICTKYNQTGELDERIFSLGLSLLNEQLYNDIMAGKISNKACVSAFRIVNESLSRFAPSNEHQSGGPKGEKSY